MHQHQLLSLGDLSRREFLKVGTIGSGMFSLGSLQNPALAVRAARTGYVDSHVHVWTPDIRRYPLASGYTKESMKPPSFTPEELFAHARPCGVERIVLIQMSFYQFDNSYMVDMMRKHKGVFSGVGIVDERAAPNQKMLELADQGVRGFRIQPLGRSADKWLEGEGMAEMWSCGAEHGLAMCPLINPEFLPSVERMCRKFPRTPVVVDHFARIGTDGQIRKTDMDNLCSLAGYKDVSVKVSAFYALGKKKAPYLDLGPMIRRVLEAFGPTRLMWASDCPFQVENGYTYKESIELIEKRLDFMTASDREWMLRKTADRVFFS